MKGYKKTVLHAILGYEFGSYSSALSRTKSDRLDTRREQLMVKFAIKTAKMVNLLSGSRKVKVKIAQQDVNNQLIKRIS